ncbi:hypothetical protein FS827_22290 [Agrobacterium vitis]|uniref:hypothetical protein n=1 Tax=Allorhizobium ampelinum TaxID=3025782 RepID=UPI001F28ACD5|nr:hypothetical protein [Allorhizobium ampelinum]MCF1464037.1 hypothetical protein [Allorhizobium ampelinum]
MNPFIQSACGLIVVVGPRTSSPLMAERMATAFLSKFQADPARTLDPAYWDQVVEMTPAPTGFNPSAEQIVKSATAGAFPAVLAGIASGGGQPDVMSTISDYLAPLGQVTALNCLILSDDGAGRISIRLACLSIQPRASNFTIAVNTATAALDLTIKATQSSITQIFGSFGEPAKTTPGYQRIYR